ncbi:MAG: lipase maturation factor family protein, partial [Myxococcales bacterium]
MPDWLHAPDYWLARVLLQRGLGVVYLIAFGVALDQFPALLGERGLLPAREFIARVRFVDAPSLFHLRYSDRLLRAVSVAGIALSLLVILGLPDRWPAPLTIAVWLVLWALYLSIVNVGQTFYGFGWESLLLEAGFLAAFLGPAWTAVPAPLIWLFRWLLFRLEFGAGLIKMRGDTCWRDLTCLYYHHETQPMPNPLSWYFHHLPKPLHRIEVAGS